MQNSTKYILAFDFSLSSTGWVLVHRNDGNAVPDLVDCGLIKTEWAGTRWWAPLRYLDFFQSMDRLIDHLTIECGENSIELAAEQVMWGGQSTPALFALHQRFWECGWKLRTRIAYLAWGRWFEIVCDRFQYSRVRRSIEKKSLIAEAYKEVIGTKPPTLDVSDAWGVAYAANRFYAYVDGLLSKEDLTDREMRFFDWQERISGSRSGRVFSKPTGLKNEIDVNYFDWRQGGGKENSDDDRLVRS